VATKSFSGGEKLEAYLKEMSKKVSSPATLRVGFLEGATYPNGISVATVALFNEYGVPSHNQPPRPFFRHMIAEKKSGWGVALGKNLVANDYDAARALDLVGDGIGGQLREAIIGFTDPPNAPSTIRQKGFDAPLRRTKHMLMSVDHDVKT
jgi:hypothetical protein